MPPRRPDRMRPREGLTVSLGDAIRKGRERLNIGSRGLADRVNVTKETVDKWEQNKLVPKDTERRALAAVIPETRAMLFPSALPPSPQPVKPVETERAPFPLTLVPPVAEQTLVPSRANKTDGRKHQPNEESHMATPKTIDEKQANRAYLRACDKITSNPKAAEIMVGFLRTMQAAGVSLDEAIVDIKSAGDTSDAFAGL